MTIKLLQLVLCHVMVRLFYNSKFFTYQKLPHVEVTNIKIAFSNSYGIYYQRRLKLSRGQTIHHCAGLVKSDDGIRPSRPRPAARFRSKNLKSPPRFLFRVAAGFFAPLATEAPPSHTDSPCRLQDRPRCRVQPPGCPHVSSAEAACCGTSKPPAPLTRSVSRHHRV